MIRVPVVSQNGKPLMPTKSSRAKKWVKQGKAVGKWSDVGIYYVQLLESSGEEIQPVVIGVDPGKSYAGIGVQSAQLTLARFHLILPFGRVKQRMEQRRMLRRSRRSRRINRKVAFKSRNHRQKRFSNRKPSKVPPSIKASRQLELRVVRELSKIFPLFAIGYEQVKADVDRTSGRKGAKSGKGFSPVMNGQLWAIEQIKTIAPVFVREGWQKDGNGFDFRVGDLVKALKKDEQFVGYIGGFTCTEKSKNVSIYDYSWKRIGQFTPNKVKLLRRSNGLCIE